MPTLDSETLPRHAPQKPSLRAHDGLLRRLPLSPAMRRCFGLHHDPGSPSMAVGRGGSARHVLSTHHPRGSLARHAVYAQGPDSERGDVAMEDFFSKNALSNYFTAACPERWFRHTYPRPAPGRLVTLRLHVVLVYIYEHSDQYLPTPAAVLCPLVPTLCALVATRM